MTQSDEAKVLYYASQAAMMNGPGRGDSVIAAFLFYITKNSAPHML